MEHGGLKSTATERSSTRPIAILIVSYVERVIMPGGRRVVYHIQGKLSSRLYYNSIANSGE